MKAWLVSILGVPVLGAGIGLQWWMNQWWSCGKADEVGVTCDALLPVAPLFVMVMGAAMILFGLMVALGDGEPSQEVSA